MIEVNKTYRINDPSSFLKKIEEVYTHVSLSEKENFGDKKKFIVCYYNDGIQNNIYKEKDFILTINKNEQIFHFYYREDFMKFFEEVRSPVQEEMEI